MLSNYSWAEYLSTIIILVFIYYLFIAFIFYSKEIKGLSNAALKFKKRNLRDRGDENSLDGRSDFEKLEYVVADIKENNTNTGREET